jgi:hypothetical protein
MLFKHIGSDGQDKIKRQHVLIVGMGALPMPERTKPSARCVPKAPIPTISTCCLLILSCPSDFKPLLHWRPRFIIEIMM